MTKELGNPHSESRAFDSIHKKALKNLDSYLQTPREGVLREHQIDVAERDISADIERDATVRRVAIKRKLESSTVSEIDELVQGIIEDVRQKDSDGSILQFYRSVAELMPGKINKDTREKVLNAARSEDPDTAKKGKRSFIFLNMRSVLLAVEPYLSEDEHENEDMVQAAVASLYADIDEMNSGSINQTVQKGAAAAQIASREHMPRTWVMEKRYKNIEHEVDSILHTHLGFDPRFMDELAHRLGVGRGGLEEYFTYRMAVVPWEEQAKEDNYFGDALTEDMEAILDSLSERESGVIRMRFGLEGDPQTLNEIGKRYGVTRERVRKIESKAMNQLREPSRAEKLREYLE